MRRIIGGGIQLNFYPRFRFDLLPFARPNFSDFRHALHATLFVYKDDFHGGIRIFVRLEKVFVLPFHEDIVIRRAYPHPAVGGTRVRTTFANNACVYGVARVQFHGENLALYRPFGAG